MCPTATLRALEAQMAELVKANQAMLVTLQRAIAGGEALAKNHLYMATVDSHGVQAGANDTKLLVRGGYSVQ